ncbi:MAG: undecaprenyl/decaprenyl-phosphate alpha-N-acetylglucosaminyl 1-phosphate transferase [Sedimentisphaerales bacterium]|nr:undecaprenyl/decaprenyl-phosphate alpha-N-acetylglucosaminyl 1-phosphate transferase [Sedimentisphaerales bacterium]
MKTYIAVCFGSASLAAVITLIVIRIAVALKVVNLPGVRDIHSKAIPRIGGIAIFLASMSLTIATLCLPNTIGSRFRDILPSIIVLLCSSSFIFFVGLIDDIYDLRAHQKLIAQITAAVIVCINGIRIESFGITDWYRAELGWLSWPVTLLWIVGITNAVNLSDGLDGLAAGISAVACGTISIFAIYTNQVIMAVLMLALLGSLTGFLLFNFNPAKIFMGDSGSQFVGFLIATSSVMCATKAQTLVGLALPVLALGIPIIDTLFAIVRRFLERRSLFAPDRGHFHHRLLKMGLKQRHVVIFTYAVTLSAAGLGMFMMITQKASTILVFVGVVILLLLVFRIAGSVKIGELILSLKHKHTITRELRQEDHHFEEAQLYMKEVQNFEQWWQAICKAADKLDFLSIELPNDNGKERRLIWHKNNGQNCSSNIMNVKIPIVDIEGKHKLNMEVDLEVNDSLESAGHRVSLLTRLMSENTSSIFPKS